MTDDGDQRDQPEARGEPDWEPGAPVEAAFGPAWSASWARASADELDFWLAFAQAACDAADEIALRQFRRDIEVMTKPDRSFVTAADQAARITGLNCLIGS